MPEIGAYEAKTHLPRLLERVQRGERFVITKHGRPVAELVPVTRRDADSLRRDIDEMRALRAALADRGLSVSELVGEGGALRDLAHQDHRA